MLFILSHIMLRSTGRWSAGSLDSALLIERLMHGPPPSGYMFQVKSDQDLHTPNVQKSRRLLHTNCHL